MEALHGTKFESVVINPTPEYDLRLSAFFDITPGLWTNLQLKYESMRADREKGEAIVVIVFPSP